MIPKDKIPTPTSPVGRENFAAYIEYLLRERLPIETPVVQELIARTKQGRYHSGLRESPPGENNWPGLLLRVGDVLTKEKETFELGVEAHKVSLVYALSGGETEGAAAQKLWACLAENKPALPSKKRQGLLLLLYAHVPNAAHAVDVAEAYIEEVAALSCQREKVDVLKEPMRRFGAGTALAQQCAREILGLAPLFSYEEAARLFRDMSIVFPSGSGEEKAAVEGFLRNKKMLPEDRREQLEKETKRLAPYGTLIQTVTDKAASSSPSRPHRRCLEHPVGHKSFFL